MYSLGTYVIPIKIFKINQLFHYHCVITFIHNFSELYTLITIENKLLLINKPTIINEKKNL